jgi:hypothetical protein
MQQPRELPRRPVELKQRERQRPHLPQTVPVAQLPQPQLLPMPPVLLSKLGGRLPRVARVRLGTGCVGSAPCASQQHRIDAPAVTRSGTAATHIKRRTGAYIAQSARVCWCQMGSSRSPAPPPLHASRTVTTLLLLFSDAAAAGRRCTAALRSRSLTGRFTVQHASVSRRKTCEPRLLLARLLSRLPLV